MKCIKWCAYVKLISVYVHYLLYGGGCTILSKNFSWYTYWEKCRADAVVAFASTLKLDDLGANLEANKLKTIANGWHNLPLNPMHWNNVVRTVSTTSVRHGTWNHKNPHWKLKRNWKNSISKIKLATHTAILYTDSTSIGCSNVTPRRIKIVKLHKKVA